MLTAPPVDAIKIVILCGLPLEASAVLKMFDHTYPRSSIPRGSYTVGRMGGRDVALAYLPGIGKASCAAKSNEIYQQFNKIELAILVGICGGTPTDRNGKEILLGDIVISTAVIQYDFGYQGPNGFRQTNKLGYSIGHPNTEIRRFLDRARSEREDIESRMHESLYNLPKISRYSAVHEDHLFQPHYLHKHQNPEDCQSGECASDDQVCEEAKGALCEDLGCDQGFFIRRTRVVTGQTKPMIHFGRFATADMVMRSGEHRDLVSDKTQAIAFEMEAAGMWFQLPWLVVKSVCDYADSHKHKACQEFAAASAAACAKDLITMWESEFDRILVFPSPDTDLESPWPDEALVFPPPDAYLEQEQEQEQPVQDATISCTWTNTHCKVGTQIAGGMVVNGSSTISMQ